jgi:hypothetical protein
MAEQFIGDGQGHGFLAGVDSENRLLVRSTMERTDQQAMAAGDAYNINTGDISLTNGADTACLYFKNNEVHPYHLLALAVGIGTLPAPTEVTKITMIRNPKTGSIITNGVAVAQNQNRNFSSSKTLNADVYKGATGDSFTDGDAIAQFYAGLGNQRLFASIDFYLPQGNCVGINVQLNDTSGGDLYVALVGYLEKD